MGTYRYNDDELRNRYSSTEETVYELLERVEELEYLVKCLEEDVYKPEKKAEDDE